MDAWRGAPRAAVERSRARRLARRAGAPYPRGVLSVLTHVLSMLGTGTAVLFVSFSVLAGISPTEVAAAASVVLTLATLAALRALRLGYEVRTGGAPEVRDARNRNRERRGF